MDVAYLINFSSGLDCYEYFFVIGFIIPTKSYGFYPDEKQIR